MREPVTQTMLLLDIEKFSRRDDFVQAALRRALGGIVDETLLAAGVEATQQYREDRGDGLIVLVGAEVAKTGLLRALLTVTPELLHDYNRLASASAQLRLRIVLASGEVAHDPQTRTTGGLVGHDLNQACRLLDADVLRQALAQRTAEDCVLLVSPVVYEGVVRHGHHGIRTGHFREVSAQVKDGVLGGWLYEGAASAAAVTAGPAATATSGPAVAVPEQAVAPAVQVAPERGGPVLHLPPGTVVNGSIVFGDQHGVSGNARVDGDVTLGGRIQRGVTGGES
ncbi:hypothetical protein ABT095_32570 [Kitasatospora sp. NPDC002227]|uniref:hypothetical protein n=1 Tax=Kitasatospora sp. NPDC002227 TaxID=3154773 RepID=UPI00331CBFB6